MKRTRFIAAIGIIGSTLACGLAFQNCSKVGFNPTQVTDSSSTSSVSGSGDGTTTITAVQSIRPVFAVRGMNCVACHGVIGSNIATDFGYGTSNFMPSRAFFPSSGSGSIRTAFNDTDVGNNIGGWQSLVANGSSVHVPSTVIPASVAKTVFGVDANTTFAQVMQWLTVKNSSGVSMVNGITPASGQSQIIQDTSISITYPSESEVIALLPAALQGNTIAVSAIQPSGSPAPQFSGLAADSSGNFIRNTASTVVCYGDVVVKGPLFLKDLNVQTDINGCRLYVSSTVFIQGPITYVNGSGGNVQITSARAVIMGMSAVRMGADPSGNSIRTNSDNLTTAGGPWPRFALSEDIEYNPSGDAINGVDPTTFFNNLVLDADAIGSELLDAGDPSYVANPGAGETVVTEPNTSANAQVGGPRISINYSGLLLNAPHIHSRYAGQFQGVIIGDVAMLARNPSSTTLEAFSYDSTFDSVPAIFPALTTQVLSIQH